MTCVTGCLDNVAMWEQVFLDSSVRGSPSKCTRNGFELNESHVINEVVGPFKRVTSAANYLDLQPKSRGLNCT